MRAGSAGWLGRPSAAARAWIARLAARPVVAALLVYMAVTFAIWRPGISFGLSSGVVGSSPSSDYQVGTWSLEWWPWAIRHGVNPLHTGLMWAPAGYPTTWMTSVPALGLLAAPLTILAGPLVSYNLLMLAAPPAAALATYLLCRELCGRFWPALLGGFLFGFSPYLLGQAIAQHLNLVMVWPLPLLALVGVRLCRGRMSSRRAIVTTSALLLFLFGCSLEVFATTVLLGAIVLTVAVLFERDLRSPLVSLAGCFGAALLVCLAVGAPTVWIMLTGSRPPLAFAPEQYATDVANLIVPTPITFGGTTALARDVSGRFVGNVGERDGYLGAPLVVVCVLAAWSNRRHRSRIAAAGFAVSLAWSFGPALVIAGRTLTDLPFSLDRIPMFALALPSRLAVFVILAAACLAVGWLARPGGGVLRVAIGVLIALSFTPQLGALTSVRAEAQADRAGLPSFAWQMPHAAFGFLPVANHLAPDATMLALPANGLSPTSFWQAASDMRFRVSGGYTPFAPPGMATDPLIAGFMGNAVPPLAVYRLRAYLAQTHTGLVVVRASADDWTRVVRSATGVTPRLVAGSQLFSVNAHRLRVLLRRPSIPSRRQRGVELVGAATPVASLVAARAARVSLAAWLTYDWRTRHVVVEASVGASGWSRAAMLSNRRREASALSVAAGGRRSIVAWIEADGSAARLRVSESRGRGIFRPIAIPQLGSVALQDDVALATNGVATVAWTTQDGARAVLHALRIAANGRVSATVSPSDPGHSVDAFRVSAAATQSMVAWRERDATVANLLMATLQSRSPRWSAAVMLSAGAIASAPIAVADRFGPVVVWARSGSFGASLSAERLGKGGRGLAPIQLAGNQRARIATPSVAATARGVLVAWCAGTRPRATLHIALITASRVVRYPPLRSPCVHSPPRLLAIGARTVLNSAPGAPQLYVLAHGLVCSTLARVRVSGAYRLLAGASGVEAVTASGMASGTVAVRSLAPFHHRPQPCRLSRRG